MDLAEVPNKSRQLRPFASTGIASQSDNLVWVSSFCGANSADLFSPGANFDVCVHDYAPSDIAYRPALARYYINKGRQEKLETAASYLPELPPYNQYAFLDDDIQLTTQQINKLFDVGASLHLPIWQPALSQGSYGSHSFLFQQQNLLAGPVRPVSFVEIMMPFFSYEALNACLWSFDVNISGWGLDCFVWPKILGTGGNVIDPIAAIHNRAPARRERVMRNGLTPRQECWIMETLKYDGVGQW